MGSRTRFTEPFFTYARFLETTGDSVSETTYMNIRAPYNSAYQTVLPADYAVKPITRSFYEEESAPRFTGSEDYKADLDFGEEQTVISIQNVAAFEPRYFELEKETDNESGIGFFGDVEENAGELLGSVTSGFTETVEDCALLFNYRLVRIGDLDPGETVELNSLDLIGYPWTDSYRVAAYLSGESGFDEADISSEEYINASEKTKLLAFYLDNYMPYYTTPSVRMVGFIRGGGDEAAEDKRGSGITVVTSTIPVYSADEEMLYRSGLVKTPRILGGNYDTEANALYGIDPVTLEYSFGNDVEIQSLSFDYVSDVFTEKTDTGGLASFSGSIYFYNQISGAYDEMDPLKTVYSADELKLYLSGDNTMSVRYVYVDTERYNWNILLPMLNIVGREY